MPFANHPHLLANERLHAFSVLHASHYLSVVEELARVYAHDCHGLIDFILQSCDAFCEANHATLMPLHCLMTVTTMPGQCNSGSALDCCTSARVLMEGVSTWAAAVATWALVGIKGDVLIGVAALRSRTACRFLRHSCLVESVGMLVGL